MPRRFDTKDFKRNEDGGTLVYFAVSLTVLLGMIALSFDTGRVAATQSEVQSFADSVALAAAAELDGSTGSRTRAINAAKNMIEDSQTFGTAANRVLKDSDDYELIFLKSLPADDTTAITSANYATSDEEAVLAYVQVPKATSETNPTISVDTPFADIVAVMTGGTARDWTVSAEAVAGYELFACDVTPLMFCLPDKSFKADANKGVSVQLKSGGSGAAWGPGDFGFLDPTDFVVSDGGDCESEKGNDLLGCLIAAAGNIGSCVSQRGVTTLTGQKTGNGAVIFNTRFDMFEASVNSWKNDPKYAPGPHTVAGIQRDNSGCVHNGGGQDNPWDNEIGGTDADGNPIDPPTMAFPPDTCHAAGTCTNRFGDGVWSRSDYERVNYTQHGATAPTDTGSSRYEYYIKEIENHDEPYAPVLPHMTTIGDDGYPTCHATGVVSSDKTNPPDRRTFIVAGINCDPEDGGTEITGKTTNVPVQEFVKVFLLNPVNEFDAGTDENGNNKKGFDMWVEIVESVGGYGTSTKDATFRDIIRLHR